MGLAPSMGGSRSSIPVPTSGMGGGGACAKRGSRALIPTADKSASAAFGGAGAARASLREPEVALSPQVNALHNKWRHVWLMTMDRRRKLQVTISTGAVFLDARLQVHTHRYMRVCVRL